MFNNASHPRWNGIGHKSEASRKKASGELLHMEPQLKMETQNWISNVRYNRRFDSTKGDSWSKLRWNKRPSSAAYCSAMLINLISIEARIKSRYQSLSGSQLSAVFRINEISIPFGSEECRACSERWYWCGNYDNYCVAMLRLELFNFLATLVSI